MQLGAKRLIPANLKMRVYLLKVIPSPFNSGVRIRPLGYFRKEMYPELNLRRHAGNLAAGPAQVGMRMPFSLGEVWSPSFSGCPPHGANTFSNSAQWACCHSHEQPHLVPSAPTVSIQSKQAISIILQGVILQGMHLWNGSRGPYHTRTIIERFKP